MPDESTIVALSSGVAPSGVAVIRLSGNMVTKILVSMTGNLPSPRAVVLRKICDPQSENILDKGLVIYFPGPRSFTGEDTAEFQIHGGRAVISAVLDCLLQFEGVRLAEAGEFSRRAFENGRMDLTEIEGLSDLIAAETEAQRKLALSQASGDLLKLYEGWRTKLVHARAMIEAELDFTDEEDVPEEISELGFSELEIVSREIQNHLNDNFAGEIIREGFRVALMGKPNAGKSSLLNCLVKRDVAIVTAEAGTTRDLIEVNLDLNGYPVIIQDTAGIRETENVVELEGIKRAENAGRNADLLIWLSQLGNQADVPNMDSSNILQVVSKDDNGKHQAGLSVSSLTGYGIDALLVHIRDVMKSRVSGHETGLITRKRYRLALKECLKYIELAVTNDSQHLEIRSENLRLAGDCIGRVIGKIDVEDLLDVIFSEFCVGK